MHYKNTIHEYKDIIAIWMLKIMDKHNISAHRWALMADTAPTNITRFLMYKKYTPRIETMIKLAAAINEEIPIKFQINNNNYWPKLK